MMGKSAFYGSFVNKRCFCTKYNDIFVLSLFYPVICRKSGMSRVFGMYKNRRIFRQFFQSVFALISYIASVRNFKSVKRGIYPPQYRAKNQFAKCGRAVLIQSAAAACINYCRSILHNKHLRTFIKYYIYIMLF